VQKAPIRVKLNLTKISHGPPQLQKALDAKGPGGYEGTGAATPSLFSPLFAKTLDRKPPPFCFAKNLAYESELWAPPQRRDRKLPILTTEDNPPQPEGAGLRRLLNAKAKQSSLSFWWLL
jgi:hypothetical protein